MTLEQLEAEVVIASDIHISSMDTPRGQLALRFLENLPESLEFLVLNGDIFDFCFGKNPFFQEKFSKLGEVLTRLASKGVKVIFVEGNHEFALQTMSWRGIEFVEGLSKTIQTKSGDKIAITHGDMILDDVGYKRFRGFIKSKKMLDFAAKVPGKWLDAYALRHAKISRSRDEYRKLDHNKIVEAAFRWLVSTEATIGVFGHFHIPYSETAQLRGVEHKVFCVESWDSPNILVVKDRKFFRAYLDEWMVRHKWVFLEPLPILNSKVIGGASDGYA